MSGSQSAQNTSDNQTTTPARGLGQEEVFSLDSVAKGFEAICKKSADALYQDTLNAIYIESKRQEMSQTIFTTFTEIDELDGRKDGHVAAQQFVDCIKSVIGPRAPIDLDTEFLSLKYRRLHAASPRERERVYYERFYKDYLELEKKGLGKKIHGLDNLTRQAPGTVTEAGPGAADPLKVQIPREFSAFYVTVEKWIENKHGPKGARRFCDLLVREDRDREGYLTNRQFHESFKRIGMALK